MLEFKNINIYHLNDEMKNFSTVTSDSSVRCQWSIFRESDSHIRIDIWLPGNYNADGNLGKHCNDIVNLTTASHHRIKISADYSEADVTGDHNTEAVQFKSRHELATTLVWYIRNIVSIQEEKYPQSILGTL